MRTIILVVAMALAALAVPRPTGAGADLLGTLLGGGSQPPPPQQSGTPPPSEGTASQSPPSAGTSGRPQRNPLLAPESACRGQSDSGLSMAAETRTMQCMLSYARTARGLPALRPYKPLRVAAAGRARDIRRCHRLSHDACGRDLSFWLSRVGFMRGSWIAGEMLAIESGQDATPLGTTRAWLASKEHRAVLFHPRFDLIGVGTVIARYHGMAPARIWVAQLGYLGRR